MTLARPLVLTSLQVFALQNLRPGQRLQLTQTPSRLVAAVRGSGDGRLSEVVTLVAPSDDLNCRSAHLAAISFREALRVETSEKIWLLIIDRSDRLNATIAEVRLTFPSSLPITLLRTFKVITNEEYHHDHAYVLWLMKVLKTTERDEVKVITRSLGVRSEAADISTRTIMNFPAELLLQIIDYLPELSKVALGLATTELYKLIRTAVRAPRFRYCLPDQYGGIVAYLQDTMYMESLRLMGRQWNRLLHMPASAIDR